MPTTALGPGQPEKRWESIPSSDCSVASRGKQKVADKDTAKKSAEVRVGEHPNTMSDNTLTLRMPPGATDVSAKNTTHPRTL